jgi:hypothetical protein
MKPSGPSGRCFELYDETCRRLRPDFATAKRVRTNLERDTAHVVYWMGHPYPERSDFTQARGMLWRPSRLYPRSETPRLPSREI